MKRDGIFGLVVIALIVVSVGGYMIGSGKFDIKSKPVLAAPITATNDKTMEFRANFMDGCMEDGAGYAYCSCGYDMMINKYGFEGLVRVSLEYLETNVIPDGFIEIAGACLYLKK